MRLFPFGWSWRAIVSIRFEEAYDCFPFLEEVCDFSLRLELACDFSLAQRRRVIFFLSLDGVCDSFHSLGWSV